MLNAIERRQWDTRFSRHDEELHQPITEGATEGQKRPGRHRETRPYLSRKNTRELKHYKRIKKRLAEDREKRRTKFCVRLKKKSSRCNARVHQRDGLSDEV